MNWIRTVAAGAVALCLSAAVAGAQTFGYTTSGVFTSSLAGCNGTNVCGTAGQNLTFTGATGTNVGSGSTIDLGSFKWTGDFASTAGSGDVMFTIVLTQTSPTAGVGNFAGQITGTIRRNSPDNFSSLVWTPNQTLSLSPVTYTLVFDQARDGVVIPYNGGGVGAIGTVSAVPEPGTVLLLGSGIAGLGLFGFRRRRTQG